jgi:type IV pilus assembly protein PilV
MGFSLIEVLIALVVLSFGVLSALGLQAVSKRTTQNANQRTLAVQLAGDLFERIRNNFTLGGLDVYVKTTADHEMGEASFDSEPASDCTPASPCTPGELALFDLWAWERILDGYTQTFTVTDANDVDMAIPVGGLVDPTACLLSPDSGHEGEYTIVIVWRSSTPGINPILNQQKIDACGGSANRYGENNQYRQLAVVTTYIAR